MNRSFPFVLLLLAGAGAVAAADTTSSARPKRPPPPPVYLEECSGCHAAFLPRMLPAASWRRLLQDLPHHFASDASLDAATAGEIERWLVTNAGDASRFPTAPAEDRITRTRWFTRQHDEIGAKTWQRAAIGKPSNCTACHRTAEQGVFNERDLRIPK